MSLFYCESVGTIIRIDRNIESVLVIEPDKLNLLIAAVNQTVAKGRDVTLI